MWKVLFLALVVSPPVVAEEKVWYCEMTGLAQTTPDGPNIYRNERFRMKVTRSGVDFAHQGYLADLSIPMATFVRLDVFHARNDFTTVYFADKVLNIAMVAINKATAISAYCDDF